jgi:hypothetical protein
MRPVMRHLDDLGETGLALDQNVECCIASTRDDQIVLPVPKLPTPFDVSGAIVHRNTLWNMGISMGVSMPFRLSFPVSSWEIGHEVLTFSDHGMIHVLINGLVANMHTWQCRRNTGSDLFWRPSQTQLLVHVGSQARSSQALPTGRSASSLTSSPISTATTITLIDRTSIALELP